MIGPTFVASSSPHSGFTRTLTVFPATHRRVGPLVVTVAGNAAGIRVGEEEGRGARVASEPGETLGAVALPSCGVTD